MRSISQCPECQEWVSLPLAADRNARARCPLCDAEYMVDDVLKNAPPDLILLDEPLTGPLTGPLTDPLTGTLQIESPADATGAIESAANPTNDGLGIQLAGSEMGQVSVQAPVLDTGDQGDDPASFARRPVSNFSLVRFLRNIVLGGFVGLALGYYILLLVGGPDKDFLGVGSKLPRILLPSSFEGHL